MATLLHLPLVKCSVPIAPFPEAISQLWTAENPAPRSHIAQPQRRGSPRWFGVNSVMALSTENS